MASNLFVQNASSTIAISQIDWGGNPTTCDFNCPCNPGDSSSYTLPSTGTLNLDVYVSNGISNGCITVTDSLGNVQNQPIGGGYSGIATFTNVNYDGITDIQIVINDGACIDCTYNATFTEVNTQSCLENFQFIIQYNELLGTCPGGHECNGATFYVRGNITQIGTVYLSNTGGSNDQFNYPSGEITGFNRYNTLTINSAQAAEITSTSVGGNVTFALICATPPDQDYGWGFGQCHNNVTWIQVFRNGVQIYNACPNNNFLTINPCTGIIS